MLCRELETAATTKASDVELSRVKEMLKSSMLMNLESRAIVMEDLGRQILAADKMDREQQFLTQLTPNAIRAAEVELSSVFSSVIGSLLTNMLTREPDLVARHMGVPTQKAGRR